MSTYIPAPEGDVAERVLITADAARTRWIAERFLRDTSRYSNLRDMSGYTGTFDGVRVSVQTAGMGLPSVSIYVTELTANHHVKAIVRVGTCSSLSADISLGDVVLASGACTDSAMNRIALPGVDYAPVASFALLRAAADAAADAAVATHIGTILSTDAFYHPRRDLVGSLSEYGVLAVDMEASALYTLAAKHRCSALAVGTVADHLITGKQVSEADREEGYAQVVGLALRALIP
jgi:purine-nucleoside phosphorylase